MIKNKSRYASRVGDMVKVVRNKVNQNQEQVFITVIQEILDDYSISLFLFKYSNSYVSLKIMFTLF